MDDDARVCDRAIEIGNLDLAEPYCRRALGEPGSGVLSPAVESRRLFTLGRLLRQRARYAEALDLVTRSVTLELRRDPPEGAALAERRVELALIHAGRGEWQRGAAALEACLADLDALSGRARETAAHVLRQYARHGDAAAEDSLATRFLGAARALDPAAPGVRE